MVLKNRRTQKNKTNRRKQQSKRGGKRIGKNTRKNLRNKRQSRIRRGGTHSRLPPRDGTWSPKEIEEQTRLAAELEEEKQLEKEARKRANAAKKRADANPYNPMQRQNWTADSNPHQRPILTRGTPYTKKNVLYRILYLMGILMRKTI